MKNIQEEIRALIQEFTGKEFTKKAACSNVIETIQELLNKFGIEDVSFHAQHLQTYNGGKTMEHLLIFTDYDIMTKLIVKSEIIEEFFDNNPINTYSFLPYESQTDKGIRLAELLKKHTGKSESFAEEYNYIEPVEAIRRLLSENDFEDVKFEMEEIDRRHFRGNIEEEHRVTFSDFGIMAIFKIDTYEQNNRGDRDDVYQYFFDEEEDYSAFFENMINENSKSFKLTFQEAIESCLDGKGFIRGEDYAPGIYIRNMEGVLVVVDGSRNHQVDFNMMITEGALRQKYKLFLLANRSEIGLE